MIWTEKKANHVFIYHNGTLIYKRWIDANGRKTEASMIFNIYWPNEKVIAKTEIRA
jgi:hypothetical protein